MLRLAAIAVVLMAEGGDTRALVVSLDCLQGCLPLAIQLRSSVHVLFCLLVEVHLGVFFLQLHVALVFICGGWLILLLIFI